MSDFTIAATRSSTGALACRVAHRPLDSAHQRRCRHEARVPANRRGLCHAPLSVYVRIYSVKQFMSCVERRRVPRQIVSSFRARRRGRDIAAAVNPALRLSDFQRVDEVLSGPLWIIGLWLGVSIVMTAVALLLSLAGIYAVMSFIVARAHARDWRPHHVGRQPAERRPRDLPASADPSGAGHPSRRRAHRLQGESRRCRRSTCC